MLQYVADAFADGVFEGNPAAICVLDQWPPESLMQQIARENNLSETAFVVPEGENYHLRWFTLSGEIDLCGHATLAASYVLFRFYCPDRDMITFETLSGRLTVCRKGDLLEMNFPAYELKRTEVTEEIVAALGVRPAEAWMGRDLLCVLDQETDVRRLNPDLEKVQQLDGLLCHVTARGTDFDCVSRTFAPKCGMPEDPVCGSGHCHIIPYWAARYGKSELVARQASPRGGTLYCRMAGGQVVLAGRAALYAKSEIYVD